MAFRLSIRRRLFFSHLVAVLLVSGSIGTYFYASAHRDLMRSLQSRLRNSAALVGRTLDARALEAVRTRADTRLPSYRENLERLRAIKQTNPDIAFLYVMRLEDGRVFFVIDTDKTDAQALPGTEYTEVIPSLLAGFVNPSADPDVERDEWGYFMSGYAPLANGEGRYLVGIDMRAADVEKKFAHLKFSGFVSLVFSILLAMLFCRMLSSHFLAGIHLLISRCRGIAEGRLGERLEFQSRDEFDHLVEAFNSMSQRLAQSQAQSDEARDALRLANSELEFRVGERTRELSETNVRLQREIEARRQMEEMLVQCAQQDPLTGLMNRRAMMEQLYYQVGAYQRSRKPIALLMVDIDHFKRINDRCGHQAGDTVLKSIAARIQSGIRKQDRMARWGGEEFLLLLPDTDARGAAVLAEKVRALVAGETVAAEGETVEATISIGVTEYRDAQSVDDFIRAADLNMYQAKRNGRNRVVPFDPRDPVAAAADA